MTREFKVVFEFQNEEGRWMPDYLSQGYNFKEADMIAVQLRQRENVRNVRIEPVHTVP